MRKSTREHSNKLKLELAMPVEKVKTKSSEKPPVKKRSSLTAIPAPDPKIIFAKKVEIKKEAKPEEDETLNDALCNSYKFVVNYGIFESNFEWLPCETLIHIFDFLNTRDLMTAGMVCRSWMEATQYFRLMRKLLLHFQIFKYSDTAYPMNRFINCSRFFPNVKFSIVKFTPKNDTFWQDFGDTIEELTFNSCLINKPEFLHIVRLCPNLRLLSITRCDDLYKTWSVVKKLAQVRLKFNLMKSLAIYETSVMTKANFDFMLASAPNLSSITLQNCFGNARPRDRAQILDALIEYIESRPKQIKSLNLANTHTDEFFLLKLAEIKDLKLEELRFTFNGTIATIGKSGVVTLLRNQTDVKTLDVTDSKGLSNLCLLEICRCMTKLKKLVLNKCWLINDCGLKEVSRLENLEVLDVSCCDRVTDLGLLEGLVPRGKNLFKLKELHVGLLPYMSILAIYRLAQHYDELEVLDLSGSSNSITDEALQMLFRYQTKLKYLNLDCCAKITDYGLTGLTESAHDERNYCCYNINGLTDLRFLNLGGCYHVTDSTFYNAFKLSELREVNLSRCHNITEAGLKNLCKKCPNLLSIDLSECLKVLDSTVAMITKDIMRLEVLKLNGCTQITNECFEDISNCKYLNNLHIRRCPKILGNPFEDLKNVRYIYYQ